ncbi:hypothetical protein [Mesorhizobium sp. LjNodule214]|uniref:hypothetical protein n=1 Tax=Mesorhizobium sp. LjNodule214 TaxID=3342252 RepID=UPI003ED11845
MYGGFRFVDVAEYDEIKKKIGDLNDVRSQAIHRAAHRHVTERDVAQFSQWVAWMIMEMVNLSERGYTTLSQIKREADRLDAISGATQKDETPNASAAGRFLRMLLDAIRSRWRWWW